MVEDILKRLSALDDRLARLETQEGAAGAGTSTNVVGALVRRDGNGDFDLGSRIKYKTANADGGSWAILGLDAGAGKGVEVYDYAAGTWIARFYGDGRVDLSRPNLFGGRYIHGYPYNQITTFSNSWAQASLHGQDNYVAYHQDATGKVFLSGAISGGTVGSAAFTLAAGLRPSAKEMFYCPSTGAGGVRVDVSSNGEVTVQTAAPGTVYLDNISFFPSAYDSLFTPATLISLWVDFASGWTGAGYYRDPLGRVHLRGLIKSGSIGATAFAVPAGSRVWRNSVWATISNSAFGRADCYANGNIIPVAGSNVFFSLSGVMYPSSDVAPEAAWIPLQQNGFWQDYDAVNWPMIAAWVDATGRVHLNGMASTGTINALAHILPPGLRPLRNVRFPVASNNAYGRLVAQAGSSIITEVGSNAWVSYGGAHWLPAN